VNTTFDACVVKHCEKAAGLEQVRVTPTRAVIGWRTRMKTTSVVVIRRKTGNILRLRYVPIYSAGGGGA